MAADDFDTIADALYALSPRDFTAARDERAAEARKAGDRDAAASIKALRKPTVTAWLANQLVRRHRDEVEPLLELGAALREATATLSGPELRQLSRQRNEVVAALVRQARRLSAAAGQPVSEEASRGLSDTLNAALADPDAGEALLGGRLTEALQHSGFGTSSGVTVTQPPKPSVKKKKAKKNGAEPSAAERERAERRAQLEGDLEVAWSEARAAADKRTDADGALAAAQKQVAEAQRRLDELRAELAGAESAHQQAADALDRATEAATTARDEADQATRRVTDLRRELDEL
jgi:hypothetical protein